MHSFVGLLLRNKHTRKKILANWQIKGHLMCVYCRGKIESIEQLYFECSFSHRSWQMVLKSAFSIEDLEEFSEVD